MDEIHAQLDQFARLLLSDKTSDNDRLGVAMLAATHFIGLSAGIMARISEKKGGPQLDIPGWSEEIAKKIIAESKKGLRQ